MISVCIRSRAFAQGHERVHKSARDNALRAWCESSIAIQVCVCVCNHPGVLMCGCACVRESGAKRYAVEAGLEGGGEAAD